MRPSVGFLQNHVMVSASITISVVILGLIDQPATSRLNMSITTARYSQPSSVQMWVRSAV